ncbi:hypothetical protein NL473_28735, partial [Klebsiella pneumoniae]|nr:hypothetical protein [Klebsiella pneumoniae]MCP6594612.1 hypothetical protein [Klebsiella pneumoniae]
IESAAAAVQEDELKVLILAFGDLMAQTFAEKRGASVAGEAEASEVEAASPRAPVAAIPLAERAGKKAKSGAGKPVREKAAKAKP